MDHYDREPVIIKSPGRVNLIGEHTDYNDGFVLPAAINKVIILALAPNNLNKVRLHAMDIKPYSHEHDLSDPLINSGSGWPEYIYGAMNELGKAGKNIGGFDCVFGGDIPIGSGLSSSAALTGGIVFGLSEIFDLDLSKREIAFLAQKTENDFVGVNCGIMDQFVSLFGKAGHVIKLDCRSLEHTFFRFSRDDLRIVLCDTKIHRELVTSEYNIRREQCETGVNQLSTYFPAIKSLRDVDEAMLREYRGVLDPVIYKRCKYVVEENRRVISACEDLTRGDYEAFGERMFQSHDGLRDEYEVSCRELDVLVEAARNLDGVFGARMMGGGFGGCTINLVEDGYLKTFTETVTSSYMAKTGEDLDIYATKISGGTESIITEKTEQLK